MNKSDLIDGVSKIYPTLRFSEIEMVVNTVFNEISAALARGNRIELRGFGAFSLKHRMARIGRNPRIGEQVAIPEKYHPFFRVGKQLRERINSMST